MRFGAVRFRSLLLLEEELRGRKHTSELRALRSDYVLVAGYGLRPWSRIERLRILLGVFDELLPADLLSGMFADIIEPDSNGEDEGTYKGTEGDQAGDVAIIGRLKSGL